MILKARSSNSSTVLRVMEAPSGLTQHSSNGRKLAFIELMMLFALPNNWQLKQIFERHSVYSHYGGCDSSKIKNQMMLEQLWRMSFYGLKALVRLIRYWPYVRLI